ncbi:hypothetical protein GCM10011297_11980 [Bacterioplanes sanyensis]|uniref:hypothetical protein n=1 Tax=Bacterioplanes sanyensis TaxID=1249553 RepID=UPI001677C395|nr:hypothetical protein [Bacterioplanes sanyensis]GGY40660.1 hypothetical protein GCM10011297_11980 [Bacterioplanes sanyensis]
MQWMRLSLLLASVAASGSLLASHQHELAQPVPLYSNPALALSVRHTDSGWQLLLCHNDARELQTQHPLVLSVDGEFMRLSSAGQMVEREGYQCHAFRTRLERLQRMAEARQVLLRAFFVEGRLDTRVTGTEADYLTRPRLLGPLGQIGRFIDNSSVAENSLVSGG